MTPFTDEQAHRIAKLAAEHVHAWEVVYAMRAVVEALPTTAQLRQRATVKAHLALAIAQAEETWAQLVRAVKEAEAKP